MCPPSPQKTERKIVLSKGHFPHKTFYSDDGQSIIKTICVKFHRKPNGFPEIEKNTKFNFQESFKKVAYSYHNVHLKIY